MKAMAKIGLDPGHGGQDRDNRGPTGYIEADGVLDIALACRETLISQGYGVIMTRETDKTLTLGQRAEVLNQAGVDLAVSIHTNAAAVSGVRGIETIHSIHGGPGEELAAIIANRLQVDLNLPLRRIFCRESKVNPGVDYYGIIRKTKMPCVIVEVEFHTNPEAERLLKNISFRNRVGISIAYGIISFIEGRR